MTINFNKHKDDLLFLPLGGAREIGMNLNLYHYKGKWLIVDLGAGFADEYFPGIDLIVPDITFLDDKIKDIVGIVLTHAHEDHLGAVQYLWEFIKAPIYTTPFTGRFLKEKLKENNFNKKIKINIIPEKGNINLAPFDIEMVPITHSAPEMQGLLIKTEIGKVFHTGDWKFDDNPIISKPTDYDRLKQIGDDGVLALVGDSTNVFNETASGSEGELYKSLEKLISECKKTVVVTTFASNVARLQSIITAAKANGRRVALAGRSLWRIFTAATESGYFEDFEGFLDEDEVSSIPREKLLIISTGCQGEPLAATTKMATGQHKFLRLVEGDSVIFSSKIIPGNEKKIFKIFNQLVHIGVEVFTEKDHFVHVSGHPSAVELKRMYELIRPKISVPVHGELVHMHEHAKLAKKWGVPYALQIENGVVAKLGPKEPEILGNVISGYLGVDGNLLLPGNSPILKIRRKMIEAGIVFVVVVINKKLQKVTSVCISTPGVLDREEDYQLIHEIKEEILSAIENNIGKKNRKFSKEIILNIIKQTVRSIIKYEIDKAPVIDAAVELI